MKSVRIEYTIRPEVDLEELKQAIRGFVAGIGSLHPENRYTSFQYEKNPRRFVHVGEIVEEVVPVLQAATFFSRFTTYLREQCAIGPEVMNLSPVASTLDFVPKGRDEGQFLDPVAPVKAVHPCCGVPEHQS